MIKDKVWLFMAFIISLKLSLARSVNPMSLSGSNGFSYTHKERPSFLSASLPSVVASTHMFIHIKCN